MTTNLTDNYDHDIFLSYNKADEEWTRNLAARIEQEDWQGRKLKAFFAPWDIRPGQSIPLEIERGLQKSRKVSIVLSPESMASAWVELERMVTTYIAISAREDRLIPLLRKACDVPALLQPILSIDFTDDSRFEENYQKLLTVIKDEPLPRASSVPPEKVIPPPALLPRPPIVGFVARRDEAERDIVQRLRDELTPEKNQLVALWGAGGVGKTTLAAEAVREIIKSGQRVIWVSADGRTNFTLSTLLDDIAEQLGRTDLRPLAIEQKDAAVHALIAHAPMLIVLDNFETISPAEQLLCIDFLAQRARCPVLITTREWRENVYSISLHPMRPDEANDFLDRVISQTRDPGIYAEVNRSRIFETAEYNPLIIQWIAGQINLAQGPEEVLGELAHGEGSAAHRVFDRSFNLPQMAEGGRAILLALSLFMPSATRPALAEVAGMGKDKDKKKFKKAQLTLASLWLIKATDGGQRLAVEGLTRELAKARLSRDMRSKTFRPRFVARFLRYAESKTEPTAEHLNSMEAEKDNILAAIDVAFESKDWRSMLRITVAARNFLDVRGYWDEAMRINEEGLEVARNLANERWIRQLTHNLGMAYQRRGAVTKARRLYEESLELGKRLSDQVGIASTLHQLAIIAQDKGELEEAWQLYSESLKIKKSLRDEMGISIAVHELGRLAQARGEFSEARRLYGESLEIAKKLRDESGIAITLHQLGSISLAEKEFEKADRLFEQSLFLLRKLEDKQNTAECLESIGNTRVAQSAFLEARTLFVDALLIAQALPDRFRIASVKRSQGLLAEKENDRSAAIQLLRDALNIFNELGSPEAEDTRRDLERVERESS